MLLNAGIALCNFLHEIGEKKPKIVREVDELRHLLARRQGSLVEFHEFLFQLTNGINFNLGDERFRNKFTRLNTVNDIGDESVKVWARPDDVHDGARRSHDLVRIPNVERLLARVEYQVPPPRGELSVLDEEFEHVRIAHGPDQIRTAHVLVLAHDGDCRRDSNAASHQDLIIGLHCIVVGAGEWALHPDGTVCVALECLEDVVGPVSEILNVNLALVWIGRVLE
mmetsp:Transcript_23200/g.50228  ORF Transcript_23200/g.50228 Transcript_23200/m.50228 type:complete len:225 (+) Transcript_23200:575-1249(+)